MNKPRANGPGHWKSMVITGPDCWNQYREENPDHLPDLSGMDLSTDDLSGFNLRGAVLENANLVGKTKLIVAEARGANPNLMRQLIDQIRQREDSTAVFLAAATGERKVVLVAGVSRDLIDQGLSAGDWVKRVAPVVGGGGGGKPDMAQAGGKQPDKLEEALHEAKSFASEKLQV